MGFVIFKLMILPGALAFIVPGAAILALLVWAGRLMLKSETAAELEAKVEASDLLHARSYGFQVQQVSDSDAGS